VAPSRPLRRPVSVRLATAAVAIAAVTSTTTVAFTAAPAQAQSLKDRIASAQRQLSALDAKAEVATEHYNAARIRLQGDQQRAQSAQRQLDRAHRVLGRLRRSVSAFAAAAYKGDTISTTMGVTADSPQAFLDKLTTLQAVANSQSQALAGLAAAQRAQEQAQASATAALAAQQASTTQMESDRSAILAAAHQEQQILSTMQAREAAIIRAAKARAARIAAEQAAAALRVRQQAAAAAVQALSRQSTSAPVVQGSGGARAAVQWAYRELGKPYQWGAAGPDSFDCSGLTMYVWGKAGVYLDHYTGSQWNQGQHVSRGQLQPGDLVFFGSDLHHVGLYIGSGRMIEAPHTGANVRISDAFRSDYAGAVRPGT
jgi:cell wall-associated NlpC family hydrolase